jgi:hypothetical protein
MIYSINELLAMLKIAEAGMHKDTNHVMMVNNTRSFKKGKIKKGRGVGKAGARDKPKGDATPDIECFVCKKRGHWRRNCTNYLVEKKKSGASSKGIIVIHVIDVFFVGPH